MTESELYKELGILTKEKDKWENSLPCLGAIKVVTLNNADSVSTL